jgi:hypothetical protein
MQDIQNIPNPDVNSGGGDDGDFGDNSEGISDAPNTDVEQPKKENPTPNDRIPSAPIEEPPADEDAAEPKRYA